MPLSVRRSGGLKPCPLRGRAAPAGRLDPTSTPERTSWWSVSSHAGTHLLPSKGSDCCLGREAVANDGIEACQRCGRPFRVFQIASGVPTAREREPITCPYCDHTIERTTHGVWQTHKLNPVDEAAWLAEHTDNRSGQSQPPRTIAEVNKDLSTPPRDATEAEGYTELYQLWREISDRLERGRFGEVDFSRWDEKVKALLRPQERERLQKPLRPHVPLSVDTIQYARNFHLIKILWARQGVENFMTDTGY